MLVSHQKALSLKRIIVWVSVCFLALCGIGVVMAPRFVHPIPLSHANICINNLRNIDQAKKRWALEHKKSNDDTPTWAEITPYLQRDQIYYEFNPTNNLPPCPSGGEYIIGKVGDSPTCSIGTKVTPGHYLP